MSFMNLYVQILPQFWEILSHYFLKQLSVLSLSFFHRHACNAWIISFYCVPQVPYTFSFLLTLFPLASSDWQLSNDNLKWTIVKLFTSVHLQVSEYLYSHFLKIFCQETNVSPLGEGSVTGSLLGSFGGAMFTQFFMIPRACIGICTFEEAVISLGLYRLTLVWKELHLRVGACWSML